MLTILTSKHELYDLPGVVAQPHNFQPTEEQEGALLVSPVFHNFLVAGSNELGYAFLIAGTLPKFYHRTTIFLTYSQANAASFKGYVLDLVEALKATYPLVSMLHVPYATCGVPMEGSILAITGSHEEFKPQSTQEVVLPSNYFEGLLSHVPRNRSNYPLQVSARGIGAVRSDLHLLPSPQLWDGKSLMVEYRDLKTTKLQRLKKEHVGKLFGIQPTNYSSELSMCIPAGVIEAFA